VLAVVLFLRIKLIQKYLKVMKVAVIMGSTSDWDIMKAAVETLEELGIEYEKRVISAHRTPHLMVEYAESAKERGIGAIIAGAGGAAHVAGVTAALTTVPVIGVPIRTSALGGLDSLL
jgi:5-(carboxyamino)imidazole ribonucleotide mutase